MEEPLKVIKHIKKKSDASLNHKGAFFNDMRNASKKLLEGIKKTSVQENKIEYICNPRLISNLNEEKKDFHHYYSEKFVISEGSSSVVKVCLKKNTYEKYAVKIIRLHSGEELLNDFKNEFLMLREVDCPHIPKVYEFYYNKNKGKIHIVMELLEVPDLTTLVYSRGFLSEYQACMIFKKILEAISYLHNNFICHRDLKPDNILSSNNGEILKIIDFNVSKKFLTDSKFDPSRKDNMLMIDTVGNMAFAAPELLIGFNSYTEQVDLWSAGVLLYFMLCGEYPFTIDYGKTILEKMKLELEFHYIWDRVSDQAKDLVKGLLQYDSKLRYNADQALKHSWFQMEHKNEHLSDNDFYDVRMGKSHEKILKRYYNQVFVDAFSSFNINLQKQSKLRPRSIEKSSKQRIKDKLLSE